VCFFEYWACEFDTQTVHVSDVGVVEGDFVSLFHYVG
jgi:hypothetical protein